MEHGDNVSKNLFLKSAEKPFVKLEPSNSLKLVFSYLLKRIKIKITAVSCFEMPYYVTRNAPETSGDFRETGPKILD